MAKKETSTKEEEIKLTRSEIARLLGSRSLQISFGAPFMIKLTGKQLEELSYNPIEIAKAELKAGAIPLKIVRAIPETLSDLQAKDKPKEK